MCKLLEHSIELTVSKLVRRNAQTIVPNASPSLSSTDFHCIQGVQKEGWLGIRSTHDYASISTSVRRGMMMKKEDVTTSQSDASYQSQTGLHELDHNGSLPLSDPLYRLSTILEPRANLLPNTSKTIYLLTMLMTAPNTVPLTIILLLLLYERQNFWQKKNNPQLPLQMTARTATVKSDQHGSSWSTRSEEVTMWLLHQDGQNLQRRVQLFNNAEALSLWKDTAIQTPSIRS